MEKNHSYALCLCLLLSIVTCYGQYDSVEYRARIDCVIDVALSQIGNAETSWNEGEEINTYFDTFGFARKNPWCSLFVMFCFDSCGIVTEATAWSPSWFTKDVIYKKGAIDNKIPLPADVAGYYVKSKERIGHVGIVYRWQKNKVALVIEGNTSPRLGDSEGDCVAMVQRFKWEIYKVRRVIW
jgi:hypothetical protein